MKFSFGQSEHERIELPLTSSQMTYLYNESLDLLRGDKVLSGSKPQGPGGAEIAEVLEMTPMPNEQVQATAATYLLLAQIS